MIIGLTNTYAPKAAAFRFDVTKEVIGEGAPPEIFTFCLTGSDGAPMPNGNTERSSSVQAGMGPVEFGMITFTGPGTWTYTISEARGAARGFRYDDRVFTVKVDVTDAGDGTLAVVPHASEGGVTFQNRYTDEYENPNVQVHVNKIWKDTALDKRPEWVEVQLYKDGAAYGPPVKLNAHDSWSHTWSGLDQKASWTVDEITVLNGYQKSVTHQGNNWVILGHYVAYSWNPR